MEEIINNYIMEHPSAQNPMNFFATHGVFEVMDMIQNPERKGRKIVLIEKPNLLDGGILEYENQ